MEKKDVLRYGIIGFGNMGSTHAANLFKGKVPHAELAAICDTNADQLARAKALYPDIKLYGTDEEIINDKDIDAIVVAVPHYEHPPLAISALAHDKHVLIEKPAGVYITSTGETPGTNRLEIACDRGQLIVENNKKITFLRNEIPEREWNATPHDNPFAMPPRWTCDIPVDTTRDEAHVGIFKNFTRAALTGSDLLAPGEEGILGLTISNAIHYSAWTGKTVDVNNFPHDEFYDLLQDKIKHSTVQKKEVQKVVNLDDSWS